VKSTTTGRTYWAMEIAGDYERPKEGGKGGGAKRTPVTRKPEVEKTANAKADSTVGAGTRAPQTCRLKIWSLCL